MGQAVIHFEVIGKDGEKLQDFYSGLFGWKIDANNPANYGVVQRDGNTNADGVDYAGHVTFYVEVPDVDAALARAQSLGGKRIFGPDQVPGTDIELGQFADPEGHVIGLMRAAS
jgi:predicted enzyme related to lactoylglutathione lyase